MRINIASSHRFHLLDLARELEKHGHEVRFYSYVPTKRAMKFGLKKENSYSLFLFMVPFLLLEKITRNSLWTIKLKFIVLDFLLSWFMKPCDVYIALGTVYSESFRAAKRKYNATTILEWGSKHIIEQLKQFADSIDNYPKFMLNRELNSYDTVDYISIPATHVKESFIKHGYKEDILLVNPYGVDLSMFYPTTLVSNSYDIIMVGGWRFEKGCDLLIDVCEKNNFSLLHVGSIVGLPFPQNKNMHHIDAVDQRLLIKFYSQAKVFALPSRSEGLALVQAQAIACGLPIVCSENTGGSDLRQLITDKKWICVMNELTSVELERCLYQAIELAKTQKGLRSYILNDRENLTWGSYGVRYNENFKTKLSK